MCLLEVKSSGNCTGSVGFLFDFPNIVMLYFQIHLCVGSSCNCNIDGNGDGEL